MTSSTSYFQGMLARRKSCNAISWLNARWCPTSRECQQVGILSAGLMQVDVLLQMDKCKIVAYMYFQGMPGRNTCFSRFARLSRFPCFSRFACLSFRTALSFCTFLSFRTPLSFCMFLSFCTSLSFRTSLSFCTSLVFHFSLVSSLSLIPVQAQTW